MDGSPSGPVPCRCRCVAFLRVPPLQRYHDPVSRPELPDLVGSCLSSTDGLSFPTSSRDRSQDRDRVATARVTDSAGIVPFSRNPNTGPHGYTSLRETTEGARERRRRTNSALREQTVCLQRGRVLDPRGRGPRPGAAATVFVTARPHLVARPRRSRQLPRSAEAVRPASHDRAGVGRA